MTFPHRVGFFGGTFDPIHQGHLEIAEKAVKALKLDKMVFIPCRRSPHKLENPGATDAERLEMLRRALIPYPDFEVNCIELEKPPPSYTWQTIRDLKPDYPENTRLFLLIGLDQWEALPRWKNPEILAELVEFIVVGRAGHPSARDNYRAHFLTGNHPASSSKIRSDLANGRTPAWLPDSVLEFIREKGLYSSAT